MTTVAQMIEWLKTLPQDAEVECGRERQRSYYTEIEYKPVDFGECVVFDYSSEEDRSTYPQMAGKIIVKIGS